MLLGGMASSVSGSISSTVGVAGSVTKASGAGGTGGSASGTVVMFSAGNASQDLFEVPGLTLKGVEGLVSTGQGTTLPLEVGHVDSGKGVASVMLSSVVMLLVDRDCGVDNMWFNGLLVNHWLDGLVHVMVNMLASHLWDSCGSGVSCWCTDGLVFVLSSLVPEVMLGCCMVTVIVCAVLNTNLLVVMLLRKDFPILHWLD